jgi:hypothetical protein
MRRLSGIEPPQTRRLDDVRAPLDAPEPEAALRRELEERARNAEDRLRGALGDVRLFLYAEKTLGDAAVAERMRSIAEHQRAGRTFENARRLRDYVAERNLEAPVDAACRWEPNAAVETWLSEQPIEVVSNVLDFLCELCEHPERYPRVHFDSEPTPRQYAAVPGTDVVIVTFTVTDGDPRIVHGVNIERDTRFWAV